MKLVELAQESLRLLKESGAEGLRSDDLARMLMTPKRRVYDVVAVLRALGLVTTRRRFNGTTITWVDRSKEFVPRAEHERLKNEVQALDADRKALQIQVVELKEELRQARARVAYEARPVQSVTRTEFSTTQLRVRCHTPGGFKRVTNSGMEVLLETSEPGMSVDPSVTQWNENEELLRVLQRV
ncbi:MAG: hypothetical protein HXY34_11300 [Candidatus Thorarchaeota archaeon]|nr:hypothetical protein [Candidatus Thorarchaeota archaeon]